MEISINTLLERVDDFLFERASRSYRAAAGLEGPVSWAALHAEYPELSNAEVLASVRERLESPRADDTRKARLTLLHRFLLGTCAAARLAPHDDAIALSLRSNTFPAVGRLYSLAEAARDLPRLASREARDLLERELAGRLHDGRSPWAARADALLQAAAPLGQATPQALVEGAQGRAFARSLPLAQELLASTADAYRDLLHFALKRLDPGLRPSLARLHDAERAAQAPWLSELLRREDLEHAVVRCLGDLGLPPNAAGRLAVDAEPRPGRLPGARVFVLRAPDEVRLLLAPDAGLETWAAWLSAWGTAQHQANVARTTPFVERALGDAAVPLAVGQLVESFLLDEGWLKRYVRLTASQAREVARLFAFRQVQRARREAALLPLSLALLERGPADGLADEYVQRLAAALEVQVPKGRWLFDADPLAPGLVALDAFALEGLWHWHLRERFNEDYWRNPATGRWLVDLASKGQRDDALAVATQLGHEALSVGPAARRRVAVMGA